MLPCSLRDTGKQSRRIPITVGTHLALRNLTEFIGFQIMESHHILLTTKITG
jgi:hypothetical protein